MNDRVAAIQLPIPPSLNRTYRVGRVRGKSEQFGKGSSRGVIFKTKLAKMYAEGVRNYCQAQRIEPMEGPVKVTLTIYRPRKAGDLDNYLKVLLDALQGALYLKDSQIRQLVALLDDSEPKQARVIVLVEETL